MRNAVRARRAARRVGVFCGAIGAVAASGSTSIAQTAPNPAVQSDQSAPLPDPFHELETKYLFGFTEGADIGAQGEQSVEFETTAAFQKRGGRYSAVEQEIEYEGVPSQFFGYELSAHVSGHDVEGVDGLANAHGVGFSGLSTELRYLVIGRGPGSPIGLTLIAEPEWARIDDFGQPIADYSSAFGVVADAELIANRLYGAVNMIDTPDIAKSPGQSWQRSSTIGATTGLAYRLAPKVTGGGEVEYYRAYDGLALQSLQGQALYVGPTLHIQFTGQTMLAAAFSSQVAGRAAGESYGLDLTNFPRHRVNLKLEFEF
jgi:hypothetical protein